MSCLSRDGISIHYEIQGRGPWLTLAHALAGDLGLWDEQVAELAGDFTLLRYDLRGHGGSNMPPAPWQLADLAADVIALWDALGIERSHFVGLSLGGMIGQHLALAAPHRIDRLVLAATSSGYASNRDSVARLWAQRIALVAAQGMNAVVDATQPPSLQDPVGTVGEFPIGEEQQLDRASQLILPI